jgi:hypothetical protein
MSASCPVSTSLAAHSQGYLYAGWSLLYAYMFVSVHAPHHLPLFVCIYVHIYCDILTAVKDGCQGSTALPRLSIYTGAEHIYVICGQYLCGVRGYALIDLAANRVEVMPLLTLIGYLCVVCVSVHVDLYHMHRTLCCLDRAYGGDVHVLLEQLARLPETSVIKPV